jgi:two-component system CheB/CheR fusion protein
MLVSANRAARGAFGLAPADLGRPLQDLEVSYRPAELRSLIERAYADDRTASTHDVEHRRGEGGVSHFVVEVVPLRRNGGALLGACINFHDVTHAVQLQRELASVQQDLQRSIEDLQSANEELETTNEELQSTNEELETTNEELQSSNEELETMNEELQSTNEELRTMNDELQARRDELHRANAFLESILGSIPSAMVVVSRDGVIQMWKEKAEDLWGVRPEEAVGRKLAELDIGLPMEPIEDPVRRALGGERDGRVVVDAVNRRGRSIRCAVTCSPLEDPPGRVEGAILLMLPEGNDAP